MVGFQGLAQEGYFSLYYLPSLPLGETGDFTDRFSWRGVGVDFGGMLNDEVSAGLTFDWNVFYEDRPNTTYTNGTETITGNQYRYINLFPMMAHMRYWFEEGNFEWYLGGQVGACRVNEYLEIGYFGLQQKSWNFAVGPEVAINLPTGPSTGLLLGVKYLYIPKSNNNLYTHQMLNFKVGFLFL